MRVVSKIHAHSKPFITETGFVLKKPLTAYEEYGNPEGPVMVIAHGGLSDHHSAGIYAETDAAPGWWDALIGPDKAMNTHEFRVISFNALGSMFGTTGPASENPDTGKPYGPDFPEITLMDMARYLKDFLDDLQVKKVFLMAGPSMGSMLTLQTAALYPDFIGGVFSAATAGRMTPGGIAMHRFIVHALTSDAEFNGGHYEPGQVRHGLRLVQEVSRIYYTHERIIDALCYSSVPEGPDAQKKRVETIDRYLTAGLEDQLQNRDPLSYIRLVDAINTFNLGRDAESYEAGVRRISCPVLLINLNTDGEFPPRWAEEVAEILNQVRPGQAKAITVDSRWGHVGCLRDAGAFAPYVKELIERIKKS